MIYLLYILVFIAVVIAAIAIWIKVSMWIMGLGVDDNNEIDWPWKNE